MKIVPKLTALTLGLASTMAPSAFAQKQSGENCNVSVHVKCLLDDGEDCADLERTDECSEMVNLNLHYKYCNDNDEDIVLFPALTEAIAQTVFITDPKFVIGPDNDAVRMRRGCREYETTRTVNTCTGGRRYNAQIKMEGHIEGHQGDQGYYCYGFDFLKMLIRPKRDDDPISPPNIALDISCTFESTPRSRNFDTNCNSLPSPRSVSECTREVRYTYTVTNNDQIVSTQLQALIGDESVNLLSSNDLKLEIGKFSSYSTSVKDSVNICSMNGDTILKKAVAVAASPTGLPGLASAEHRLTLRSIGPNYIARIPYAQCIHKSGVSCEDYSDSIDAGCFSDEVEFKYNIVNVGFGCHDIEKIRVKFGADSYRTLALDGVYSCSNRESCPGNEWTLSEKRFIDTCVSTTGTVPIKIEVDVGSATDDVDMSWDAGNGAIIDDEPKTSIKCTDRPSELWFEFNAKKECERTRNLRTNSKNKNKNKNSNKSSDGEPCTQHKTGIPGARLTIKSDDGKTIYFDEVVSDTKLVKIGDNEKMSSNIIVDVHDTEGNIVQELYIHTSCSQGLHTGTVFGALELVGFVNDSQGSQGRTSH